MSPEAAPGQDDYAFQPDAGGYSAVNPAQNLRLAFDATVKLSPRAGESWSVGLRLAAVGVEGAPQLLAPAAPDLKNDRVEYAGLAGDLAVVETFANGSEGLAQVIAISRVSGAASKPIERLVVELELSASPGLKVDAVPNASGFAAFSRSGETLLLVSDIRAADAAGRDLPVRAVVGDGSAAKARIAVESLDAVFPISLSSRIRSRKSVPQTAFSSAGPVSVPPSNDTCPGAETIPDGPYPAVSAVTADITDATTSGDPVTAPSCAFGGGPVSRSLWYTFTPAATALYTIGTCASLPTASTVDDTVVAVFTSAAGCGGPFTQVNGGCDDDSCSTEDLQSVITDLPLAAGTTYYIVAWQFGVAPPAPGNTAVQLYVNRTAAPPAPPNDLCPGAEILPDGPYPALSSLTADITHATSSDDPGVPSCQNNVSRSLWYTFTPSASAGYVIGTCADGPTGTTVVDSVVAVYTSAGGCAGPFTEVPTAGTSDGCDDDSCVSGALQAVVNTTLAGGSTYYILVWQYGTDPPPAGSTAVQLRIERYPRPVNDLCGSATPLLLGRSLTGTTASAADDYELSGAACFALPAPAPPVNSASSAAGRDVVYAFTAPAADRYSFRVSGYEGGNPVLYLTNGCLEGSSPIVISGAPPCLGAANRNSASTVASEEVMCLPLAAGTRVFAIVDESAFTNGGPFTIQVDRCVREVEPNGTPITAGPSVCGIEGSIAPAGDADFFSLGTPAAAARVFALASGIAANSTDFDMRITTATDTLEYDDLNADIPFGSLSPMIAGTRTTGAPTYVRVDHFSAVTQSEPYRLYAAVQCAGTTATPESEPNDAPADADTGANSYFAGTLAAPSPSSDIDVFRFDADAGAVVFIGLDGDPDFDGTCTNARIELLDGAGQGMLTVNDAGSTSNARTPAAGTLVSKLPVSCGESLAVRAPVSGAYFVRVTAGSSSTGPSGSGTYHLSITPDCAARCSDGNACTAGDLCVNGACASGTPLDCDDGNPCTDDSCDPATGCVHLPNDRPCDDGNTCTENDVCSGGFCQGGPVRDCGDGNPCTDDSCHTVQGCVHQPNAALCSDGNACTAGDACAAGTCRPGTPLDCNDGNTCTMDTCDPSSGCAHAPNSLPCSDGNACTANDACAAGTCVGGAPLDCNDGNVCTSDSCEPSSGCRHVNNDTCNTKGLGYWKRLCIGPHSGDFYTQNDVECVNDTCVFAGVGTIAALCDRLQADPENDRCERAEAEFMGLMLNLCRQRVLAGQSIDSRCGPHRSAGESRDAADAALCDPGRTGESCLHAECAATEIVTGEALWANTLRVTKDGSGVRLNWSLPYVATAAEAPRRYLVWRRSDPRGPFVQIGQVTGNQLVYLDTQAAGTAVLYEYEVTAVW